MISQDFSTIFNVNPSPNLLIEAVAPHFPIVDANEAFLAITGRTREQLIGHHFFEAFSDVNYLKSPPWSAALNKVLESGEANHTPLIRYLTPPDNQGHSQEKYFKSTNTPVFGESGKVKYILKTLTDVTEVTLARNSQDLIQTINGIVWEADAFTFEFHFVSDQVENILGYTAGQWLAEPGFWTNHMHPDDRSNIPEFCPMRKPYKLNHGFDYRMIRADGEVVWIRDLVTIIEEDGVPVLLRGFMVDITETKRLEDVERLERSVLEINAGKDSLLSEVLSRYVSGIERIFPGMICSIMGIKNNRLQNWASPSLPESYLHEISDLEIGPKAGSCGTAAFTKKMVVVEDIASSPVWVDYKHLALNQDLLACWSHPIILSDGTVIATFAAYYRKIKAPDEEELRLVGKAVALLTVILENRRNVDLIADSALLISQGQELARFGTWQWDLDSNVVSWSDTLYSIYGLNKDNYKPSLEGYLSRVHPADQHRVRNGLLLAMENKSDVEFEERIVHSSGEVRYLKTWGRSKLDEVGKVTKMIGACLDITESKKIQEELLASETRLRNLVDAQTNYVIRTDLKGNYTYYNSKYQEDFGWFYQDESFIGINGIAVVMHYHRLHVINVVNQCLRNPGQIYPVEVDHVQHSEKPKTVYWHFLALTDSSGNLSEIQCIGIDVSERKQAIDDLRRSNERYELLNMATNDAIYDWDLTNDRIEWGGGFLRLFGFELGQADPTGEWAKHLHPEDREATEQNLRAELADRNQNKWAAEYRFRRVDGTYAFVEEIGYISRNRQGRATRMIGVMRDVSRQKHEQYELKLLGSVITNTNDAVLIAKSDPADATGLKILYVNAAFTRLTGYSANEVVGKSPVYLRKFKSPLNNFEKLQKAIAGLESVKSEVIYFVKDDTSYFINLSLHPVVDGAGTLTHWISIGRDVTDKRRYISEIEERNKKLQQIAWMQSHVIRAPLARLMSLIDLMTNYENSAEETSELLGHILTSAHLLDDIIRDISAKTEEI
jgi:PAS domain S-box-containing protein